MTGINDKKPPSIRELVLGMVKSGGNGLLVRLRNLFRGAIVPTGASDQEVDASIFTAIVEAPEDVLSNVLGNEDQDEAIGKLFGHERLRRSALGSGEQPPKRTER